MWAFILGVILISLLYSICTKLLDILSEGVCYPGYHKDREYAVIMQKEFRARDPAEEPGSIRAPLNRPKKAGKISVANQRYDECPIYDCITEKMCEGSNPSSFPPSSTSERGSMTVREAGRRGGLSCLRNRGRGFFVEIGRKGQCVMRARHPNMAQEWGRLGGRPRKLTLREFMGQESK